jgi:hypothetical protein
MTQDRASVVDREVPGARPVECVVDGQPLPLGRPQERCVLALLLLDVGRVVPVSRLVELLRCFCEQGGNKSAAAAAAHLSRTAYYQQLSRIAQVLGVSLEDPVDAVMAVALWCTNSTRRDRSRVRQEA